MDSSYSEGEPDVRREKLMLAATVIGLPGSWRRTKKSA